MDKKILDSKVLPTSKDAPFSELVQYGDLVFMSGQVSTDLKTGELVYGDIKTQTKHTMDLIKAGLEDIGLNMDKVIKTTIYLRKHEDFDEMNKVYNTYFPNGKPARICVYGVDLYGGLDIEIELVAGR